ncbi:MAG: GNAT family N-acetyltransferase [Bacilli bacterium]|nr:GNAT family N-acetyltransferase [Bacilli bacterium]
MVLSAKNALGKIPSINPDLLDIKSNYLDRGDMFWVALDGARVIGCVGYETINPGEARVHRLYIKPDLKRQGVGTALMQTLEEYIKNKGYKKMSIHIGDEKYWESKLFYKAKGFIETQPNILERNLE